MSDKKNTVPAIISLKDNQGEIPNGGTTTATSVQLSGSAFVGEKVEILDGAVSKGQAVATVTGIWSLPLTGLTQGVHSITAKGNAGTSPARTFIVFAAK